MGIPLTYVDTEGPMFDWEFNGTDLQRAYMDNVLVFVKALRLHLPCNPNYTSVNLRDFIDARNPRNIPVVIVYLDANCSSCHHPTINSGNLSGLKVFLKIRGSLEAGSPSTPALNLTSPLHLENTGCILGYGGRGGNGGKGAQGDSWIEDYWKWGGDKFDECGPTYVWYNWCCPTNQDVYWAGGGKHLEHCATTISWGSNTKVRRGSSKAAETGCPNTYAIQMGKKYYKEHPGGAGGAGGAGGVGQYYKHAAEDGDPGKAGAAGPKPEGTRGRTGGRGGHGGEWYLPGEPGQGGGSAGRPGGPSIVGARYLDAGSTTGYTLGPIVQ